MGLESQTHAGPSRVWRANLGRGSEHLFKDKAATAKVGIAIVRVQSGAACKAASTLGWSVACCSPLRVADELAKEVCHAADDSEGPLGQ
jgi:hypothetical protein